jgi:ribosomal protein L11 methyltransferase
VPEDWQHRWREFHRAVRVGPLWVGPPWLTAEPDAIAVVIDPGRAFGTGAHPTTQLCLQLLLDLAPRGGSVIDIGCGSGVLSIAARKLGFEPVIALDQTRSRSGGCRERARERRHGRPATRRGAQPPAEADIAVGRFRNRDRDAGGAPRAPHLLTSGYLATDGPEAARYRHVERRELDGWAADSWSRA